MVTVEGASVFVVVTHFAPSIQFVFCHPLFHNLGGVTKTIRFYNAKLRKYYINKCEMSKMSQKMSQNHCVCDHWQMSRQGRPTSPHNPERIKNGGSISSEEHFEQLLSFLSPIFHSERVSNCSSLFLFSLCFFPLVFWSCNNNCNLEGRRDMEKTRAPLNPILVKDSFGLLDGFSSFSQEDFPINRLINRIAVTD